MNIIQTVFNVISNLMNKAVDAAPDSPVVQTPTLVPVANPPPLPEPFITIPPRDTSYSTGNQFANQIMNIGPTQEREDLILAEVTKGNIPDFMRTPVKITLQNSGNTLDYYILPDVLCIGSNDDFVRVPLNPLTAQKIADTFNCCLPTKQIADQIWQIAPIKLTPIPGGPPYDASMQFTKKFVDHNARIELQRAGRPGVVTGHKKDVVICKHLLQDSSRVAIYGWFYLNGIAIQGLNPTDHDKGYKDYSHGIRLVARLATLNGQIYDLYDILKDPVFAPLISHEG